MIRNTFVPINQLPPEILSRVLEYYTQEQDLVGATHVCQHWRSVLISSPSLWSCFQFESEWGPDRALAYFERSKSVPIDLSITVTYPEDIDMLKCLAPNIPRTRSLIIRESSRTSPAFLLFRNPAPSLQHLEIHSGNNDFVCLPDDFLGQQAPSLRFVNFNGVRPTFETLFPLPNLTEFRLYLPEGAGLFRMSALFRFLSDSPLLEKLCIRIPNQTTQDIPMGQVISLESLVELEYTYNLGDRVLPYLKLPRLKHLQVAPSLGSVEVQKLADILPYDVRVLLAGATTMSYNTDAHSITVSLLGNGVSVTIVTPCTTGDPPVGWFFDQTCIPFDKIEDLEVNGCLTIGPFPLCVFALENLRVLHVCQSDAHFVDVILRSLHPDPAVGVPCRSLREIECIYLGSEEPFPRSLISLARERKRAGCQLGFVRLGNVQEFYQGFMEELREYVEKVQAEEWECFADSDALYN